MTVENIKELKRNIVVYGMETSGIEVENNFSNSYVVENLVFDNDMILYNCNTYRHDGENDTQCTAIIYNDVNEFLKTPCMEIISKINVVVFYNTVEVEF